MGCETLTCFQAALSFVLKAPLSLEHHTHHLMFSNILLCSLILIKKEVVTIATATIHCIYHTWRERYKQTSICHSGLHIHVFLFLLFHVYLGLPL